MLRPAPPRRSLHLLAVPFAYGNHGSVHFTRPDPDSAYLVSACPARMERGDARRGEGQRERARRGRESGRGGKWRVALSDQADRKERFIALAVTFCTNDICLSLADWAGVGILCDHVESSYRTFLCCSQ